MRALVFLFAVLLISGCNKKEWSKKHPNLSTKISFTDTSYIFSRLPKSQISFGYYTDSLIYYVDNGEKVYHDYVVFQALESYTKKHEYPYYMLSLGAIHGYSALGAKEHYIDWPNGDVDTIYADYFADNSDEPNYCNCWHPLRELKYNGEKHVEKTDFNPMGIYIFDED